MTHNFHVAKYEERPKSFPSLKIPETQLYFTIVTNENGCMGHYKHTSTFTFVTPKGQEATSVPSVAQIPHWYHGKIYRYLHNSTCLEQNIGIAFGAYSFVSLKWYLFLYNSQILSEINMHNNQTLSQINMYKIYHLIKYQIFNYINIYF